MGIVRITIMDLIPEIIHSSHIGYKIRSLVDQENLVALVLITPYFKPWPQLDDSIKRAARRGVKCTLVIREGEVEKYNGAEMARLLEYKELRIVVKECPRLHAKLYCGRNNYSETKIILTSMNLLETSVNDSIEVGVEFTYREGKFESMANSFQLSNQIDSILNTSKSVSISSNRVRMPSSPAKSPASLFASPPPTIITEDAARTARLLTHIGGTGSSVSNAGAAFSNKGTANVPMTCGYCIRCSKDIPRNSAEPLCPTCYSSWSRYQKPVYPEKFCHVCGSKINGISFQNPLCYPCYRNLR
jgi:hypothetical protein